jgi:hypothetical protein
MRQKFNPGPVISSSKESAAEKYSFLGHKLLTVVIRRKWHDLHDPTNNKMTVKDYRRHSREHLLVLHHQ